MTKLLHFTADWCQPCKKIKPIIDEFVANNPDIDYVRIDIEDDFDSAKAHNVLSIPTLIAIRDEEIIGRHTGTADYEKIENLFNL